MEEQYVAKHKEVYKNRLYGLLCEREKDGSWEEFLDNIVLDLSNFSDEKKSYDYWVLMGKINSCRYLAYKYFRKTIFECMNLIDRMDVL